MLEPLGHLGMARVAQRRQHGHHRTKDTIILGTSQLLSFVPLNVRAVVGRQEQEILH